MALSAIRDTFKNSMLGKAAMAGIVAIPLTLASFGPAANDAFAGEAQTIATQPEVTGEERAIDKARAMREYSEKPDTKGIGVFINLQADAPEGYGDKIGQRLQEVFATRDIPLQYRANKSRGTATDITFYVKGYDFTYNIDDIGSSLGKVLAHHGDVWPAKTASLDGAAPTKQ